MVAGSNPVRFIIAIKEGIGRSVARNKMDAGGDIATHILVPKHSRVGPDDAVVLLEKYGISVNQLPKILKSDPAIKHFNAEVGDIIMIERKSPTAGKTLYYRTVVNG